MKILFTGGGGGHFYPIIAIAQELNRIADERKLVGMQLFYMADKAYDEKALYENGITFKRIPAGKWRRYGSILNIVDMFKTGVGVLVALWRVFMLFPDVVVGKGGYASFPPLLAARILRIPVIIHESDTSPGRANQWAAKFATRIAVSYPHAASFFPAEKTAVTGNPIRRTLLRPVREGAHEFLELSNDRPTILVLGGSQGSMVINDAIVDILPRILEKYQVIHQVGPTHFEEVRGRAQVVLNHGPLLSRYRVFGYLSEAALAMAAGVSNLVISRAGSKMLFEIAAWQLPSIVIPIRAEISHDQHGNALTYAKSGAAILLEEENLTSHIIETEIDRILTDPALQQKMKHATQEFFYPDAAEKIAREIFALILKHEF